MNQLFIKRENSTRAIIIFAGWGMDENIFRDIEAKGFDIAICYDYSNLDFNASQFAEYQHIDLYAWSMGVWAAAMTIDRQRLPIATATAINGTHHPIDSDRGIAPEIFRATIENVNPKGMESFYRRMCANNRELIDNFKSLLPNRTIESLHDELVAIEHAVLANHAPKFNWDRIIIGSKDRIFRTENQINAWQQADYTLTDDAHFINFKQLVDGK